MAACDFPINSVIKGGWAKIGGMSENQLFFQGHRGWVKTSHFSRDNVCFCVKRGCKLSTIVVKGLF